MIQGYANLLGRWVLLLLLLLLSACATAPSVAATTPTTTPLALPAVPITYSYALVQQIPHDSHAWTQGLVVVDADTFYESTGDYANSSLREVRISTGEVLRHTSLPSSTPDLYGEGIAVVGDTIFMLTWEDCRGLMFERQNFTFLGEFSYPQANGACAMEGWGLTYDGQYLIMSDGTSRLSFVDPQATMDTGQLAIVRQIQVTRRGTPVNQLNELEYIHGTVWANIWQTDEIVQIDPATGLVIGEVNLAGLLTPAERSTANVLNGIAYDAERDRLFVTGKLWPALFEIRLIPPLAFQYDQYLPLVVS
ncbi:glutaminyl-peptide cyclotransferase [Candidatus Oscillochloris fontis]|uniref:glutaminyl-peptide cyclotransferase n=1 Tax=Candidatus Oscillochloris fontis TaxID=2496868 RepID=UPI00101DF088|nr:glutaminyl-peptide cyclotransferase [Candidatus Oscillochloris fontis]